MRAVARWLTESLQARLDKLEATVSALQEKDKNVRNARPENQDELLSRKVAELELRLNDEVGKVGVTLGGWQRRVEEVEHQLASFNEVERAMMAPHSPNAAQSEHISNFGQSNFGITEELEMRFLEQQRSIKDMISKLENDVTGVMQKGSQVVSSAEADEQDKEVIRTFVKKMCKGRRIIVVAPTGQVRACHVALTRELDALRIGIGSSCRNFELKDVTAIHIGSHVQEVSTPLPEECVTLAMSSSHCLTFKLDDVETRDIFAMCLGFFCDGAGTSASALQSSKWTENK